MKKYHLKNMDCPNCAANLEANLKKLEDVQVVQINFNTSTLQIDTNDLNFVKQKIRQIEPNVEVLEYAPSEDSFDVKKELIFLVSMSILFLLSLWLKANHLFSLEWMEPLVFILLYVVSGWQVLVLAGRNIRRGIIFDENFLMVIATIGAILIQEYPEAVGVMLFYRIGEFFQDLSVNRSRRSIQSLLDIRPDYAHRKRNGALETISPEMVKIDDLILVKPGERIPLDGIIVAGDSQVDTSTLTGESVPEVVGIDDEVYAGTINQTGTLTVRVTKEFGESSAAKILDLVENATNRKAKTEKFITKFARYYTPVVVFGALGVALIPPLLINGESFAEWIYRALVLLVISCPCALVISIPLGYFGGVGGASRRGILVKGSNFLDVLAKVKTVVFDKTGTLTKGVFEVTKVVPHNDFTAEEMLKWCAYVESQSNHPIAKSILEAYGQEVDQDQIVNYRETAGQGVMAIIDGREVMAGNEHLMHSNFPNFSHSTREHSESGLTTVHVAVDQVYAGYLLIDDQLKDDASRLIQQLKRVGVEHVIMLTGDHRVVAKRIAENVGIDSFHAELLPEDKLHHLESIQAAAHKSKVAFVGDGVNDAPVIARADVGIAMGGLGSDAAIETADVVIMNDEPSKMVEAIQMGKRTRQIVWQNIMMALGIKGLFIALGVVGLTTMWGAVFADVGVALLAVFNAIRIK